MSSATAYQATDTSGFVTLTTDQTITGEKTFDNDVIISGINRLGIGTAAPGAAFDVRSNAAVDAFHLYRGASQKFAMGPGTGTGNVAIFGFEWPLGVYALIEAIGTWRLPGLRISGNGTAITNLRTEKATMAAGTTGVIADTPVASTSMILVTPEFAPAGTLYVTISAGVGFTIQSTNAADAGQVGWQRVTI
jgi:hypothetical protein